MAAFGCPEPRPFVDDDRLLRPAHFVIDRPLVAAILCVGIIAERQVFQAFGKVEPFDSA